MPRTQIILVRHAETEWNAEGRYQGQLDSPLTETGLQQVQALAERLRHEPIQQIYSSDLARCQTTANCIAQARGGQTVNLDVRLREKHAGLFQGLTWAESEQQHPEAYQAFREKRADYVVPGGESRQQVLERTMASLDEYVEKHANQQLLIVTHGAVLSTLMRHILGVPQSAPRRFDMLNGSLSIIVFKRGQWVVQTMGEVSHLHTLHRRDDVTAQ